MLRVPAIFQSLRTVQFSLPLSISRSYFHQNLTKLSECLVGLMNYTKLTTPSRKSLLSDHLKNQNLDQGYVQIRRLDDALNLFYEMLEKDTAKELFDGMPGKSVVCWTTIMNGFLQFGEVEMAERLFREMPVRDVVIWNSMIHGYFSNGRVEEEDAKKLFRVIPCKNMIGSDVQPTLTTFVCAVTASANLLRLDLGVQIHGQIVKLGYCFNEFVAASLITLYASLITLYANCKHMENSYRVFNESLQKNVVVWTTLLTGCGLNCQHEDALKVFKDMMKSGVLPNQSSFTSALNSNSTKVGCAQHGCGMWALTLFNRMIRTGVEPDEITFTGLLSACSHSGMLQKARHFLKFFSVEMKLEHYECMELIKNMHVQANKKVWLTLLSACTMHCNIDVAERAARRIEDFDPHCSAVYVLLSCGKIWKRIWSDVSRIREKMRHSRTGKQPSCSWVT
ncbi:pentatricopeptide repeat-containing protein [Pyrus ussuriensis x Pyrus communis]|uniref:Pentatricopeptide repeat-containing protein n=1 Tax=Pyrus ussuriensis x Pyrus communis TaxID=2448454 RepID=A0A5N5FEK9_9ROSA|nr:pentatricopeptide repeat-containing protein [Pyrus ussuriensis x Pyrus communis]